MLDICTGCGNIALFLAYNETANYFASDLSEEAIALAKSNSEFIGIPERVTFKIGDMFNPFEHPDFLSQVDLITCNPPYISSTKVEKMNHEISQHEPRAAFDGGPLGIHLLIRLLYDAPQFLVPGGWLCFEVGTGQGDAMANRAHRTGLFENVSTIKNAGHEARVVIAQYKKLRTNI